MIFSLSLGKGKTGLTLSAQLTTVSGVDTGSLITTGFTEVGSGFYILDVAISTTFVGCMKILDGSEILAFTDITPSVDQLEIEPGISLLEALKAIAAVCAGKQDVSENNSKFYGIGTSTARVDATTTTTGARTSVTLTL